MLQLEVERQAYYPGEIVRGRVHFTPRKDLSCVGVYVRFKGYEHSAWENEDAAVSIDPNTAAVTTQALVHSGKRKHIFKFVKTLWGNTWGQSHKKVKLKAQSYSWPFAFELPKHIPPSLEYRKGRVRIEYVLKAHVKVPYNKSVKVTKMLSVGSVVQPRGTEIKDFEVSKSSKWDRAMNLNKDSRFSLRATTKRQYTWPEDKFRFRLKIDNRTHNSFNSLVIRIQQYWKSGSLTDKVRFAKYKVTEGFPVEKSTAMDRFIEVPMPGRLTLVPTTNASLVQLSYHLVLEFHIGGLIKNPKIHIPIIISSVPVIGSTPVNMSQGPVEDDSELPVSHAVPIDIDITTHQDINVDSPIYQQETVVQGMPTAIGNMPIATPAPTAPVVTAYPTAGTVAAQPTVVTVPPPQPTRVTPIVNTYTTQTSAAYQQPKTYVPSSLSHSFSATSATTSYPSVPGNYTAANTTNYDVSNTSSFYPQTSSYTGHHANHHRHSSVPNITSHHEQSYQRSHMPSNSTSNLYPSNTGATSFNANYGSSSYNPSSYNSSSAYPTTAQSNYPNTSSTQNYGNNYNSSSYNTGSGYNTSSNYPSNTAYYNGGQQADSPPPPLPKKSPPTPHNTSPNNTYNSQYSTQYQQYPASNTAASTGYTSGQYNTSNYQQNNTQSSYNAPVNGSYATQNSTQQYQPTTNTSSYNNYPSYQSNTYTPSSYNANSTSNYTPANQQLSRSAEASGSQSIYSPPVPLSQSHDSSHSQRRLSKPLPPIPQLQSGYLEPVPEHVLNSNNSAYAEVPDDLPDDPDAVYDDTGVVSDHMSSLNASFEHIDIQDNEVLVVVVQDVDGGDFEEVFLSSPTAYSLFKDIAETFHRSVNDIDKVIKLSNQSLVKRDEQVERLTVNERLRVYWK